LKKPHQSPEARKHVVRQEARAEERRLKKPEERLRKYPVVAVPEMELSRLKITRALPGNTQAMLQVGSADDLAKAFVLRDIMNDTIENISDGGPQVDQANQQDDVPSTGTKQRLATI
jgi:hypothetical protein